MNEVDMEIALKRLVEQAKRGARRPMEARVHPDLFWSLVRALNAKVGISESEGVEWFQLHTAGGLIALVSDPKGTR